MTIGRNGRLFGRSRRKLWVETLGGGDGSRRGSVRDMFHEAVGGPWCMEREIT